ncbi:MAG: phosphate acyltransferase PlsX [Candidatus Dormibacteria bacterium]
MAADVVTVAVDAMSGDNDPQASIDGARAAVATDHELRMQLVGRRSALSSATHERIDIVEASEVIGMDEHPAQAVRSKKDASVLAACREVAQGRANAAVSAGNSGATLAAAVFAVKRIPGVHRPAIGGALPTAVGTTFLLDIGANTDCKAEWLLQFGVMGDVYARQMMGVARPRVGLLSNGEEATKGSQMVQEAHALLSRSNLLFIGNVEGRDLLTGKVDVVVTDGFTGNIALKTAEGVAEFLFATISREARASFAGRIGGALLKPRLRPLRDRVDYRKAGGALLLGVSGEVVIAHGRSDAVAMSNAIAVAARAARQKVSLRIGEELGQMNHMAAPQPAQTLKS